MKKELKIMKRYQLYLLPALIAAMLQLTACNDWLDVDSDTNVVQEILFDDFEGYRTAVNGVYMLLGSEQLYGRELTWGALSALGRNYDSTAESPVPARYKNLVQNDYSASSSTAVIDPIWAKAYNTIANCNNIINHIEQESPSFFPRKGERDLILGEMLGVRAMLHLDMVRLFTPATAVDDGREYIPYMEVYPLRSSTHLTVTQLMEKIIADLERSRELLRNNDNPEEGLSDSFSSTAIRFYSRLVNLDLFYNYRGIRMNYFAATALLARAHLWRNGAGDRQAAYDYANVLYDYHVASNASASRRRFSFTAATSLQANNAATFRKMYDDVLFAAYNSTLPDLATPQVFNEEYRLANVGTATEAGPLFAQGADDFRRLTLIEGTTYRTSIRWQLPISTSALSQDVITQGRIAPVIRMSEMFYIMCEHLADSDLTTAYARLNAVRSARGCKTALTVGTKETLLDQLVLEMTREFMTEGQTFFQYKRLNRPLYNGTTPFDMTGRYVLPVPRSENEYLNL